ncbi:MULTISPECIES: cell division protein ZipA C-terminal FtsZ-binding domain-containing protein [Pirellulaceae]|uniref:cell division protein ZipA C-terminal FtsZ-binding domain-containing protein n=1 Tax=Pirellulaceae TaxID=2691357 RepID=UPI001E592FDC|nr:MULTISPECIES: cell division protein ZipA C-terminal FtsZ-binding domain-containing protein [Pirellulaceae]
MWDVMLYLGLTWGDMDCFHWINPTGIGDDYYFSVETSTPPGYFLPEEIAAGRLQTQDLAFLFSLPRAAAPSTIAERMRKAVEYVQSRLGGEIVYMIDDEEVDFDSAMQEIKRIEAELTEQGFPPGSEAALRFF